VANNSIPEVSPKDEGTTPLAEYAHAFYDCVEKAEAGVAVTLPQSCFPPVLDIGRSNGCLYISDREGRIPSAEEFWSFVDEVARFYREHGDQV
jgi:hypothetical protein